MGVIAKAVLVLMFQLPSGELKSWSVSIEPSPKYTASVLCKQMADAFLQAPAHFMGEYADPFFRNRGSFCIDFRAPGDDS